MNTPMRILVAEDDDSMRRAIGRLLKAAGLQSVEFGSAEALLQSGQLDAADCVVTDIHLGGMSGFQLVETLRRDHRRMPAVFMTAFDSPASRTEALNCGMSAYLVKPFEGTALLEAIRRVTAFRA